MVDCQTAAILRGFAAGITRELGTGKPPAQKSSGKKSAIRDPLSSCQN